MTDSRHRKPSRTRGPYWYFDCSQCGRRYWSSDGKPHPVNPDGNNLRDLPGRPTCPRCKEPCRAAASPGKKQKYRYWSCLKCGERYQKTRKGVVQVDPKNRKAKKISFLKSRRCPACGDESLSSQSHPPSTPHWYFRCSECDASFRWNKSLSRLVQLRRRKGYHRQRQAGRKLGMTPDRMAEAARLELLIQKHGNRRGALKLAVKEVYPSQEFHSAYQRANKTLTLYRRTKKNIGQK